MDFKDLKYKILLMFGLVFGTMFIYQGIKIATIMLSYNNAQRLESISSKDSSPKLCKKKCKIVCEYVDIIYDNNPLNNKTIINMQCNFSVKKNISNGKDVDLLVYKDEKKIWSSKDDKFKGLNISNIKSGKSKYGFAITKKGNLIIYLYCSNNELGNGKVVVFDKNGELILNNSISEYGINIRFLEANLIQIKTYVETENSYYKLLIEKYRILPSGLMKLEYSNTEEIEYDKYNVN